MTSKADIEALGYHLARRIATGEWIGVQKQLFTTGLFVIAADGSGWRTRYCYEYSIDAIIACLEWDGVGDPPGPWVKQKPQERQGPGLEPFLKKWGHQQ